MHTLSQALLTLLASVLLLVGAALAGGDGPPAAFPVAIRVDASRPVGEMRPVWRFFGADEPNYATMKDGKNCSVSWAAWGRTRSTSAHTTCSRPATGLRR